MAAQTLETIPAETGAPAVAPATPGRVTSDAPKQAQPVTAKNPGRVGKRLAERNRLAHEAKKQAEAQKATASTTTDSNTSTTNTPTEQSGDNTGYLILGIGGLIVSGLGVYYQREAIMRTLGRSQKPPQTNQPAPVESNHIVEEPKRKGRIRELE